MTITLTIYGDFNCPYSCLASLRADRLLETGGADIDWRAVQHDPTIGASGQTVTGELATDIERELAQIRGLLVADEHLVLRPPARRPNTALVSRAFAGMTGDDAHRFRNRLFTALWCDGHDLGDPGAIHRLTGGHDPDPARAARWQQEWSSLEQPVTPTLVLPDGYISRGLGALARLADLR